MIIKENNKAARIRQKKKKIISMWDISLPKPYSLDENEFGIVIRKGKLFSSDVANLDINKDNIIFISFENEEDLNTLRDCLERSKNRFDITVGGRCYY